MKKLLFTMLIVTLFVRCGATNGSRPMTSFIVKNTSDKSIRFSASTFRQSKNNGKLVIKNTYTVNANDSIIVKKDHYKKDGADPQSWFQEFRIFTVDGIDFNDPNNAANWVKTVKDNKPAYTFTINK
jgi:hypothetical protein